ncbi:MAG: TrbC/VirB2 family protein [Alphaproteobacteria bacterium]|nr:TrbC/VirB2 family protein [Alphaproteobacteria bacterium]
MLKLKSLLKSNLFLFIAAIAFFAICPQDAFAANGSVFEKVRDKAASSLKDIKLVVYILAGFGLIGFSFMAIFNKISWKWFANIAISLFLLSVMGLFIDDFTGTSKHSTLLDYGNYLSGDGSVDGTGGSIGGGTTTDYEEKNPTNQNEENAGDECDGIDVARCGLSPDKCYASTYCNNYRKATGEGSSSAGNSQLVWDPETQSYMLPEVEVIGDKNLANNNPVSGLENIGGGAPNVDALNKYLQNMVNNVNQVQGEDSAAGAKQEANNGGWLNNLINKGIDEGKNWAQNETQKQINKITEKVSSIDTLNKFGADNVINSVIGGMGNMVNSQIEEIDKKEEDRTFDADKALDTIWKNVVETSENAAKQTGDKYIQKGVEKLEDKVSDSSLLNKIGISNAVNSVLDSAAKEINTEKVVGSAAEAFGWNEETSERNGQDNIGGALDAGKIPGTEDSAPDVNALNKDLQNIVNGTGNSSASDYGWNEETSEGRGYDAEPSQDTQLVWNPETQSYELPEIVVTGDASASRRPVAGSESSAPNVDALNKDLQNIVNGTGSSSASDYGWNEETSERNGYNADGTQGNSSASNYGWNEETSEGRGWGG